MRRRTAEAGTPLLAWAEARQRRQRLRRRRRIIAGIGFTALTLLGIPVLLSPAPRLVWNASPSAAVGLYLVAPGVRPARG